MTTDLADSHKAAARDARQARLNPWQLAEANAMSEAALQAAVRAQCRIFGFLAYHTHRSDRSDPGFPDLVIVAGPGAGVLWRELKNETKPVTEAQVTWITRLRAAGENADVWRPTDLLTGRIDRELRALRRATRSLLYAPDLNPYEED